MKKILLNSEKAKKENEKNFNYLQLRYSKKLNVTNNKKSTKLS